MKTTLNYNSKGYNPNHNYCTWSPDWIFGVPINFGCFLHDRHYRNERKVRATRKKADQILRDYIYRDLKKSNAPFEIRFPIWLMDFIYCPKTERFLKFLFYSAEDGILVHTKLKFLIKLRKMLAFPISRTYYYAVRWFASKAWKKE